MNPFSLLSVFPELGFPRESEITDFEAELRIFLEVQVPIGLSFFAGLDIEMSLVVDKPNRLRVRLPASRRRDR